MISVAGVCVRRRRISDADEAPRRRSSRSADGAPSSSSTAITPSSATGSPPSSSAIANSSGKRGRRSAPFASSSSRCPVSQRAIARSPAQLISNPQRSWSLGIRPGVASHRRQRPRERLARLGRVHAVDHPVLAAGVKERVAAAHALAMEARSRPCRAPTSRSRRCRRPRSASCRRRTPPSGCRRRSRCTRAGGPRCGPRAGCASGSRGTPRGSAHEASTPSRSRRRSQCRRVAWCSWITKRLASPASSFVVRRSSLGSGVRSKSRLVR